MLVIRRLGPTTWDRSRLRSHEAVNWQTTSLYSNHIVQQGDDTLGTSTVHFNTQSDVSSATAQSNIFGTQFSDSFAQFGTAHQGSVSITKP